MFRVPSISGLFKLRQLPEVMLLAVGWLPALLAFLQALGGANHPAPRVINTDGHAAYPPAVAQLKAEGNLAEDCRHRPVPYLNNVLEQDHRAIKRRVNASQHLRSFWGGLPHDRRLRSDSYDPQRPSVLECGRREGRSAPSLYCWYVWN
jgi:hypothetical protein